MSDEERGQVRAVRVLVAGRVQGVGFRAWTIRAASARKLDGWVRNLRDGRVEAVFFGPLDAVGSMLAACREGPPSAEVETVTADTIEPPHPAPGFVERPTA